MAWNSREEKDLKEIRNIKPVIITVIINMQQKDKNAATH